MIINMYHGDTKAFPHYPVYFQGYIRLNINWGGFRLSRRMPEIPDRSLRFLWNDKQ